MMYTENHNQTILPVSPSSQTPTTASWVEVSASAFLHNLHTYKKLLKNNHLAVVLKSNAYGHGLLQTAQLAQQSGTATWLCLADLQEAVYLREHGITMPILLLFLNIVHTNLDLFAQYNIDVIIYNKHHLDLLNEVGKRYNKKINVHLKIDTGMSRFGVMPHEAVATILYAQTLPFICVNGICSHLAESAAADSSFTHKQLDIFDSIINDLKKLIIEIPYIHAANSAGALLDQSAHYGNLFRIGIGVYGLWPSPAYKERIQQSHPEFTMQPALNWKTSIIELKKITKGSFVGYDRTHQTTRDTIIGLIPVGYYEGYDRRLSNNAELVVKIGSCYAPVIGRICMNITIIDVTDIIDAHIGQEVTIIGTDELISPEKIAIMTKSYNPREIVCRIHPSLDRFVVP